MIRLSLISALMLGATLPAFGAETTLQMPDWARLSFEESRRAALVDIAVGPFHQGTMETISAEGALQRQVWTTDAEDADTAILARATRELLQQAGYAILFECETRDCGGFDFRFELDIAAEPDMHVDLGDFRYLAAAQIGEGRRQYIFAMVSRSPNQGFIQLTRIGDEAMIETEIAQSTKTPDAENEIVEGSVRDRLLGRGAVVLDGLQFEKGSAVLSGTPADSLQQLADFLIASPDDTVVLVGHTDASGSLKGNIALSRKRAEAVMQRLVETYGVKVDQLSAEGVGYLSPRTSNVTKEGRLQNRRVEVVLTTVK